MAAAFFILAIETFFVVVYVVVFFGPDTLFWVSNAEIAALYVSAGSLPYGAPEFKPYMFAYSAESSTWTFVLFTFLRSWTAVPLETSEVAPSEAALWNCMALVNVFMFIYVFFSSYLSSSFPYCRGSVLTYFLFDFRSEFLMFSYRLSMLSFAFLMASSMSRSSESRLLFDSYDCLLTLGTAVLSGDTKLLLTTLVPETTAAF